MMTVKELETKIRNGELVLIQLAITILAIMLNSKKRRKKGMIKSYYVEYAEEENVCDVTEWFQVNIVEPVNGECEFQAYLYCSEMVPEDALFRVYEVGTNNYKYF